MKNAAHFAKLSDNGIDNTSYSNQQIYSFITNMSKYWGKDDDLRFLKFTVFTNSFDQKVRSAAQDIIVMNGGVMYPICGPCLFEIRCSKILLNHSLRERQRPALLELYKKLPCYTVTLDQNIIHSKRADFGIEENFSHFFVAFVAVYQPFIFIQLLY